MSFTQLSWGYTRLFLVGILSLPFVLALRSSVSPCQKSRGFSSGQMFANSQCLLKMSAGLDFPSFQLNWRYPAAMASLTLWYDANVDFFDRVDVGILTEV